MTSVTDLCILTVHAHPDDEASKGAPTLAMYHDLGVRTVLVCCTGGEEGDLQNPALREPGGILAGLDDAGVKAALARVRPRELAESAAIIGFDEVVMLGYRDSGMLDSPANAHPECFHQADLDEAVGRLVTVIRRKMYYSAWSRTRLVAVHEAMLRLNGSSPYDERWLNRPSPDERITTRTYVASHMSARSGALRAHATQVDPTESWWFGLDDDQLSEVYPWEDWILARSTVGGPTDDDVEADLFAGIADVAALPAGVSRPGRLVSPETVGATP